MMILKEDIAQPSQCLRFWIFFILRTQHKTLLLIRNLVYLPYMELYKPPSSSQYSGCRMSIQKIMDTKLDIIGDIHGEITALNDLLNHLGYDEHGHHPEDRKLIFVGDLVDRGEDSWAVYKKVRHLIDSNNAYCILGNHELNLLIPDPKFTDGRPKVKPGNEWFHGRVEFVDKNDPTSIQPQYLLHTREEQTELQDFLRPLPLVIEAPGIRIVHSCWDKDAINTIRGTSLRAQQMAKHYEQRCQDQIREHIQLYLNENPESNPHSLSLHTWFKNLDRSHPLRISAELMEQNNNPIKVITSGLERELDAEQPPYEAGKKMRYVQRDRWWERYTDDEIVICGHYWRTASHPDGTIDTRPEDKKQIPPTFLDHEGSFDWLGPKKNVMCIDYSVGKRFVERHKNLQRGKSGSYLAALRYTKTNIGFSATLLLDDGRIQSIQH